MQMKPKQPVQGGYAMLLMLLVSVVLGTLFMLYEYESYLAPAPTSTANGVQTPTNDLTLPSAPPAMTHASNIQAEQSAGQAGAQLENHEHALQQEMQ